MQVLEDEQESHIDLQKWKRHLALHLQRRYRLIPNDHSTKHAGVCLTRELEEYRLYPMTARQIGHWL